MRVSAQTAIVPGAISGNRGRADRYGDRALLGITALASLLVVAVIAFIIYQLDRRRRAVDLDVRARASSATTSGTRCSNNQLGIFGAAAFLYGTAVTSLMALLIGGPIGIAIGLFLSLLAPRRIGAVIGPLVELIAAIPSVVLGLWGVLVLAPVMRTTFQPAIHSVLGWIPLFGSPSLTGLGLFTAGIDPDDHGHPDHRLDQPRAVPQRAQANSRRERSRSARRAGRWCAGWSSRRRGPGSPRR